MSGVIVLTGVELVPVVELEPCKFARQTRPGSTGRESPDEWYRYWLDSLAASGVTGLRPLRPGSWHVPTTEFADPGILQRYLEKIIQDWGGIEVLSDPDCKPVLNGGLALLCPPNDVLIEPGCCADLGDAASWREAARYQGSQWHDLSIGHPWISVRYEAPWLVLSEPHEFASRSDRWAVSPDELESAQDAAEAEIQRFAGQLAGILPALGFQEAAGLMARKLAGLEE